MPHVFADQFAVLGQRAETALLGVVLGAAARRGDAVGHVGVFGIGQDEVLAGRVGKDALDLAGERFEHICIVLWEYYERIAPPRAARKSL